MSDHTHFISSWSKDYWPNLLQKSKDWHLLLHNFSSANTTIKWKFIIGVKRLAFVTTQNLKVRCHDSQMSFITHFQNFRLFQKFINESFYWSSTISSPNSTILWKFHMSEDWHLLLPKHRKYIVMATKRAIIHILSRLLQKWLTKVFLEYQQFLHLIQQFF